MKTRETKRRVTLKRVEFNMLIIEEKVKVKVKKKKNTQVHWLTSKKFVVYPVKIRNFSW